MEYFRSKQLYSQMHPQVLTDFSDAAIKADVGGKEGFGLSFTRYEITSISLISDINISP